MLQTKAVEPPTLALLKSLMALEPLNEFNLVGGTALALQFGHRKSIDIDLFGPNDFDSAEMLNLLNQKYKCEPLHQFKNTVMCKLDGVKTDILTYKSPLLDQIISDNGIRMLSPKDIAPMKLAAIAQRGLKKDFYDLYLLLQHFSLSQMLELYKLKYNFKEVVHVIRSMNYFADADEDPATPELLIPLKWGDVKLFISKKGR